VVKFIKRNFDLNAATPKFHHLADYHVTHALGIERKQLSSRGFRPLKRSRKLSQVLIVKGSLLCV
jgi:hypothetical protein